MRFASLGLLFSFLLVLSPLTVLANELYVDNSNATHASLQRILNFVETHIEQPHVFKEQTSDEMVEHILQDLSNSKTQDNVVAAILNSSHNSAALTQREKEIALSMCAFLQNKKQLDLDGFSGDLYFSAEPSEYQIHTLNSEQYLLIQVIGRGARNNSYLVWLIQKINNHFQFNLVPVKTGRKNTVEIVANEIAFNKNNNCFTTLTDGITKTRYQFNIKNRSLQQIK